MRFIIITIVCLFGGSMLRGTLFDINNIKHFINMHQITILPENEYLSYIDHGRQVISSLINNNNVSVPFERASYLREILSFVWYLYALAIDKDQGFINGVIIMQDNDQKLYNFLYEYVRNVGKKTLFSRALISTNPYGYGRRSTHFLHDQNKFMHYGIDIRLTGDRVAQRFLPGKKAHLLFGRLAGGLTFIKVERHGLYYKDGFLGHAGGFIKLMFNRAKARFFTQKESVLHRKEYIQQWVLRSYKKLTGKACRFKTIRDIVKNSQGNSRLAPLIEKIELHYDHIPLRYGNEVILDKKEIEAYL